jgi:hypothetical protein
MGCPDCTGTCCGSNSQAHSDNSVPSLLLTLAALPTFD